MSTTNKIGLVTVGVAFIVFALISALVLPRRYPDFPGKGLGWYVMVCVAVLHRDDQRRPVLRPRAFGVVQRRNDDDRHLDGADHDRSRGDDHRPATTTTSTSAQGDPAAGKTVFASSGCGGCHTLKDAGSTGTVGPNLDQLKPPLDRIVVQVENGGGPMPAFKGQLTDKQIQDVAAYVYASTHSS